MMIGGRISIDHCSKIDIIIKLSAKREKDEENVKRLYEKGHLTDSERLHLMNDLKQDFNDAKRQCIGEAITDKGTSVAESKRGGTGSSAVFYLTKDDDDIKEIIGRNDINGSSSHSSRKINSTRDFQERVSSDVHRSDGHISSSSSSSSNTTKKTGEGKNSLVVSSAIPSRLDGSTLFMRDVNHDERKRGRCDYDDDEDDEIEVSRPLQQSASSFSSSSPSSAPPSLSSSNCSATGDRNGLNDSNITRKSSKKSASVSPTKLPRQSR